MVKPTNENIDFATWPVAEQQQAYNELSALLGITPTIDVTAMTDVELTAHVDSVTDELGRRGTTETAEFATFGTIQIVTRA